MSLETEVRNSALLSIAGEAIYATFIVDNEQAERRGELIRLLDAFYSEIAGSESGVLIRRMEATMASVRWDRWDANLPEMLRLVSEDPT